MKYAIGSIRNRLRFRGLGAVTIGHLFGLVFVLGIGSVSAQTAAPPNILFIFADDQRADTIGAYGNDAIETPNIDRLVERGFSFMRNYCMGSPHGAVCVPSRAMVMSGRSLFRVPLDLKGVRIMPEVLREAGYVTFGTGKWHNKPESYLRGFEKGAAVMMGGMSNHIEVPVADISPEGKLVNKRIGDKFSSELFVDAAIDFLNNHQSDKPFFAYVAFTSPHDPRMPPTQYRESYYERRPPLPPNYLPQHPFDNGWLVGRDENLGPWPRTEDMVRDQLAEYYGMITHMDRQIGRLLDTLEQTGLDKNTYIIYAADHGLAVGSHGLLGKQSVYEHSMRAPMLWVGPGIPAGKATQSFTYLYDIFPTVCELTGVQPPRGVEGRSLAAIWEGRDSDPRKSVFTAFAKGQRAVRDDRWKLIRYPQINHTQLFDLENDPHETKNLAEEPEYADRVRRMMELLAERQREAGDTLALTSPHPRPKEVDLTGKDREPDRWQPDWIIEKYFDHGRTPAAADR